MSRVRKSHSSACLRRLDSERSCSYSSRRPIASIKCVDSWLSSARSHEGASSCGIRPDLSDEADGDRDGPFGTCVVVLAVVLHDARECPAAQPAWATEAAEDVGDQAASCGAGAATAAPPMPTAGPGSEATWASDGCGTGVGGCDAKADFAGIGGDACGGGGGGAARLADAGSGEERSQ